MAVVGVGSFDGERQENTTTPDPGGRGIHRQDAADERSLALVHAFLKRDEACFVCGRAFPRGSIDITSKDHSGPTASCRG